MIFDIDDDKRINAGLEGDCLLYWLKLSFLPKLIILVINEFFGDKAFVRDEDKIDFFEEDLNLVNLCVGGNWLVGDG